MKNLLSKSLLASPALLGIALALAPSANAAEGLIQTEDPVFDASTLEIAQVQSESTELINQIEAYGTEGQNPNLEQVTSVNELRDVEPTAWAYEALRSLVERYGCIVGYPDRTFRGNRALTRWEFAAGLNACMNVMERLIQENVAVLQEDIDKLKRLMEEFQAELAALGARMDNLEGRVAFLEDHQFSTTTKLAGEVIFGATGAFGSGNNNQFVFQDRVRLNFNTSFTGEDRLVTRLAAGSAVPFQTNVSEAPVTYFGTNPPEGNESIGYSGVINDGSLALPATLQTWQNTQTGNDVIVDWLAYYTPISLGENLKLQTYFAGFGGLWDDFTPTLNPYFEDYDGGNGALSTFAQRSPIYRIGGGGGAGLSLQLGFLENILGPSSFTMGYLSGTANDPSEGFGLFNGNYGALGQINTNLFDFVNIGLTYVHAYHRPESPIFGSGSLEGGGLVGTTAANLSTSELSGVFSPSNITPDEPIPDGAFPNGTAEPINTFSDSLGGKVTNSYGVNVAFNLFGAASFSAYGSYTDVRLVNVGDGDIWTYGGGIAVPDLFKEGSVLGLFAGAQPYFGGYNLAGALGQTTALSRSIPIHVELFYKYQVTDNISLTPGVIWISAPDQFFSTNDEIIGTLRGTFNF
ncbi:MAG: iron uptake porin [Microcystaceae cyanobacterium]